MKCYYGEVHSHTTESDGKGGTPADAYKYARDVGGADYFAVTDHNTYLKQERFAELMPSVSQEYDREGSFAALYGYEMSYDAASGYWGHLNVYGTKTVDGVEHKLADWYKLLSAKGEAVFGEFNHPGEKWGDFDEFAYNGDMDRIFDLIELRIEEYGVPVIEDEYERALSKGWHVSPVSNEDTHGANWTTVREETGAVLAESLSRENVTDAIKHNRTFATTDRTLKLFYRANGQWMGSRLAKTGKLCVEVSASTEKECGIGLLLAVGEHNTVLAEMDAGDKKSVIWRFEIPDDHKYVYIRRINCREYAVTAPVWVEQPRVMDMEMSFGYDSCGIRLEGMLKACKDKSIDNVTARLYVGNNLLSEGIKVDMGIDKLSAGEGRRISLSADIDYEFDDAVLEFSAYADGLPVRCSQRFCTCPLAITQFFANTAKYSAQRYYTQPFCCFDLKNISAKPCDASRYIFRFYHSTGMQFKDLSINKSIAPGETLTVWLRGDRLLSVDEFNGAFGTELAQGKQLYCADICLESDVMLSRKLLICRGNRTARRAWIRYGELQGAHVPMNAAIRYDVVSDSATEKVTDIYIGAKPGEDTVASRIFDGDAEHRVVLSSADLGNLGHTVIFSDIPCDAQRLKSRVDADSIEVVVGSNTGELRTDAYLAAEGDRLLRQIAESQAETVVLHMGAGDCGMARKLYLERNFYSLATCLESVVTYLTAKKKRVILMACEPANKYGDDYERLCVALRTVARTMGVGYIGMNCISESRSDPHIPKDIIPRAGALRIACVGDAYTQGIGGITSYPANLQKLFGDSADVRIFAAEGAMCTLGDMNYFLRAKDQAAALREFAPDVTVMWLCMGDAKIKNCKEWDTGFKERFAEGFFKTAQELSKAGGRLYTVSPFKRRAPLDIRVDTIVKEGGMADTVRELAHSIGAVYIDISAPDVFSDECIAIGRSNANYLSEQGSEYLAKQIYNSIISEDIHK